MDPEIVEILKALMDEETEDEAKLTEWVEKQKLGEKEANALKGAMRILNGFKDNASIKKVSDAMAGLFGNPEKKPDPEKEPPAKKEEPAKKEKPVKKDDDNAIPEAVQKQLDDTNARAEKVEKANEELREVVKKETRARKRIEMIAKCEKSYAHVPGLSTEEQAEMLLDADEKGRKLIEKQWAATEEAIVKSDLLISRGSGGGGVPSGDGHDKLEKIAKGMVEKSTDGLTYEQAYARALEQNPGLYSEYLDENPKQTAG